MFLTRFLSHTRLTLFLRTKFLFSINFFSFKIKFYCKNYLVTLPKTKVNNSIKKLRKFVVITFLS